MKRIILASKVVLILVGGRVVQRIALDDRREARQVMRWFTESLH